MQRLIDNRLVSFVVKHHKIDYFKPETIESTELDDELNINVNLKRLENYKSKGIKELSLE